MFARHASLAQRCTNTFITRKGGVTVEAVCGIKQATKQLPFLSTRTQIYRFHSSPTVRITADPKFSTRDDVTLLNTALQSLLRSARTGGRWVLTSNGQGLERSFKFKNFTRTWVSPLEPCMFRLPDVFSFLLLADCGTRPEFRRVCHRPQNFAQDISAMAASIRREMLP